MQREKRKMGPGSARNPCAFAGFGQGGVTCHLSPLSVAALSHSLSTQLSFSQHHISLQLARPPSPRPGPSRQLSSSVAPPSDADSLARRRHIMTTRSSRSSSIPIPSPSSTSAARSLENVISMPFASPAPLPVRPRLTSTVSRSPEGRRPRGPSMSPVRRAPNTSPTRSLGGSYSSAVSIFGRNRPSATGTNTNAEATTATPAFQPRIIRATSSPNPPRDPAACLPVPPPTSTSLARPRRLSASLRTPSSGTSTSRPLSVSLPAASHMPSFGFTAPAALHAHSHVHSHTHAPAPHAFQRPEYLEYSALRNFLHTDAAPSLPPSRYASAAQDPIVLPLSHSVYSHATATPPPLPAPYPYLRRSLTPVLDSESEETPSPSPPPHAGPGASGTGGVGVLSPNPVLRLPTRWSDQDRNPLLHVSADGRELVFQGPSCTGDRDSAAARANHPIPPACGIYYYEVEILHRGQKGHISIGFSAGDVRLSRLPGWEKHSWGYHADDGWSFPGQRDGIPYGPTFDAGDVIGCGIDFSQNKAFYTKNGAFLGMLFDNLPSPSPTAPSLFPAIGMRHTTEAVRANFGSAPFRYAIADHVRAQRDAVWAGAMRVPVDWGVVGLRASPSIPAPGTGSGLGLGTVGGTKEEGSWEAAEESKAPLRRLVLAYLAHHGYACTARAFRAQCARGGGVGPLIPKKEPVEIAMDTDDGPQASSSSSKLPVEAIPAGPSNGASMDASNHGSGSDLELDTDDASDPETRDLQARLSILHSVLGGNIDAALAGLETHYPDALKAQSGLLRFQLRCRKFVELVLQAGEALQRVEDEKGREGEKEKDGVVVGKEKTCGMVREAGAEDGGEKGGDSLGDEDADAEGAMDVDDPSPEALPASSSHPIPTPFSSSVSVPSPTLPSSASTPASFSTPTFTPSELAKSALHSALAYGQELEAEYKADARPGVRAHLKRTFGVVAYDDPVRAGGEVGAMAGQGARADLAGEVNRAILESQGRPAHPALETIYRQTAACVVQLGLFGVGAAVFADIRREFLDG
ncbi:hypothetical protein AcV7_000172 [Taiwanofungus camphoratus]|nr:hypothetical protein AcV7_000172 [Antrodia cinnamomea]